MASRVAQSFKEATIFVANLNWTIGPNELKKYFIKYGPIVRSHVIFDKDTGVSKGYGFVTFDTQDSAKSALDSEHNLEGRKLLLSFKKPNSKE